MIPPPYWLSGVLPGRVSGLDKNAAPSYKSLPNLQARRQAPSVKKLARKPGSRFSKHELICCD